METSTSLDWQAHMGAGHRYLKTATNGLRRKSVFNNELIYHLTAMAIEHLLAGVYQYYDQMAGDHTLDGLVDGLSSLCTMNPRLAESIKGIGRYDDMCPLVPVNKCVPNDVQIAAILSIGRQVSDFAELQTRLSIKDKTIKPQ
jgi:hypothetical protein